MGLSGNILVKSHIPTSKFDVFDISINIHIVRKIHLLDYLIQRLWGKSLKNYFQNMIGGCLSLGATPLFHIRLKYIFFEA